MDDVYYRLTQPIQDFIQTAQTIQTSTPAGRSIQNGISEYRALCAKIKTVIGLQAVDLSTNTALVNLQPIVTEAIQSLSPTIMTKHITVNGTEEMSNLNVLVDSSLFSQVVAAVLNNAVKFSSDNGSIDLKYQAAGHSLSLMIQDYGKGIEPAYLARLFQPFYRAQANALDFNYEGVGLSLYVAKLIMRTLHGDLNLTSTPGQGTIVTIQLPRAEQLNDTKYYQQRLVLSKAPA